MLRQENASGAIIEFQTDPGGNRRINRYLYDHESRSYFASDPTLAVPRRRFDFEFTHDLGDEEAGFT